MNDYSLYLDFAKELALESGSILKEQFGLGREKTFKSDKTAITELDERINQLVIERVIDNFPEHGVVGEEKSLSSESEFQWVCDPIDGTLPFMTGIPTFVFSLALVHKGQPIVAVVYDPILDRLFYASKGLGSYLNDKRIYVSTKSSLDNSSLMMPYRKGFTFERGTQYFQLFQKGAKVFNLWSIIYAGALVAAGELDGVIFTKDTLYDVASLALLIQEAGGVSTSLDGSSQRYDKPTFGFIGANKQLHKELVELMAE
jgi:myo-inositol-1(or 4)-monophosphatase